MTAEIINWTGHFMIAPRQGIGEALQRPEANRTGVYFLVGEDPDKPSKKKVYIGEGDAVADRIKSHTRDEAKDFWTRACFVTSKDTNLTKAHVRYLESRLISLAMASERANLANRTEPSSISLPESDIADMENFLDQIQLVLPVVGFDFLQPKAEAPSRSQPSDEASPVSKSSAPLSLILTHEEQGLQARAIALGDEIIVLRGSSASKRTHAVNSYAALREQLITDKRLVDGSDPQFLKFADDVAFASPSAAAAVVRNRNTNGRTSWKVEGTDQTLRDWQDAQLLATPYTAIE